MKKNFLRATKEDTVCLLRQLKCFSLWVWGLLVHLKGTGKKLTGSSAHIGFRSDWTEAPLHGSPSTQTLFWSPTTFLPGLLGLVCLENTPHFSQVLLTVHDGMGSHDAIGAWFYTCWRWSASSLENSSGLSSLGSVLKFLLPAASW